MEECANLTYDFNNPYIFNSINSLFEISKEIVDRTFSKKSNAIEISKRIEFHILHKTGYGTDK